MCENQKRDGRGKGIGSFRPRLNQKEVDDEVERLKKLPKFIFQKKFPMYVISVKDFIKRYDYMGAVLESHDVLKEIGILKTMSTSSSTTKEVVVFVSHEWYAYHHPDPNGIKLGHLVAILKRFLRGDISVINTHWKHQLIFSDNQSGVKLDWKAYFESAYIWLDFISMPQPVVYQQHMSNLPKMYVRGRKVCFPSFPYFSIHRSPYCFHTPFLLSLTSIHLQCLRVRRYKAMQDLTLAAGSMAAYMDDCDLMLCLAPSSKVRNPSGSFNIFSVTSWLSRGWCQLELLAWSSRLGKIADAIVIADGYISNPYRLTQGISIFLQPLMAKFTCCNVGHHINGQSIPCDKDVALSIIHKVFDRLIDFRRELNKNIKNSSKISNVRHGIFLQAAKDNHYCRSWYVQRESKSFLQKKKKKTPNFLVFFSFPCLIISFCVSFFSFFSL